MVQQKLPFAEMARVDPEWIRTGKDFAVWLKCMGVTLPEAMEAVREYRQREELRLAKKCEKAPQPMLFDTA